MKFEEHCEESIAFFGSSFVEVHKWLDEFAGKPGIGMKHRRFRHHEAGIEEVRRLWGDQAALAAKLHVQSDLEQEGWKPGNPFPKDEKDYVRMGLY